MDRRKTRSLAVMGLASLAAGAGCQSFGHRATVPPAPRSPREGGGAQFSSAPKPLPPVLGSQGRPGGPVANTASPYGSIAPYGRGPLDDEVTSAPLGGPEAAPSPVPIPGPAGPADAPGDAPGFR